MFRRCTYLVLLPALAGFAASRAVAGGYQIDQQSARGTAMGGALVASVTDPTAIHLNPAGLSFLEGTHLSIGTTVYMPDTRFTGVAPSTETTKMLSQVLFPPDVYITHTLDNGIGLGLAAFAPYALRTEWNPDWVGGRIATTSEMRTYFFTPSISVLLSPDLAVGVALNLITTKLQLSQRIGLEPVDAPDATETLEGSSRFEYGVQAGVVYRPSSVWSFGASYRSRVDVDVDNGSAVFASIPAALAAQFPSTAVSTRLPTPDGVRLGVCCQPLHRVALEADLDYVRWSAFRTLTIHFQNPQLSDIVLPEHWKDTFTARFGLEFGGSDLLVRGGVFYDQSPVQDAYLRPLLPDADKTGYSVGIGARLGEGMHLDFTYLYIQYKDRTVTDSRVEYQPALYFNGTYATFTSVIGLNVSYEWN